MGCCTNLLDLCQRTGIDGSFERHADLHFFGPDGRRCDFAAAGYEGLSGGPDADGKEAAMLGAVVLAPLGGAIGALIDGPREEWKEVPLSTASAKRDARSRGISFGVGQRF